MKKMKNNFHLLFSSYLQDKTTFIFVNVGYVISVGIPCISFNESDKIRAINMPADCLGALGKTIKSVGKSPRMCLFSFVHTCERASVRVPRACVRR